jgi:hypothetical protein
VLRAAFGRWGLPARLRVDNGHPWASRGDLPTELGLWLAGLGVAVVYNPPRRPQANGVVERSQEVGQRWADTGRLASAEAVQAEIDAVDRHQREAFPDPEHSRAALFPALAHSGRAYEPAREAESWRIERVRAALAAYAVVRRVNARGLVSVYGRNHYVGRRHAGLAAYVRFDEAAGDWLFELAGGPAIGRAAAGITYEAILAREITERSRDRGKTPVASTGSS